MAASWSVSGSRIPSDNRREMYSYKMGYRYLGFVLKLGELSICICAFDARESLRAVHVLIIFLPQSVMTYILTPYVLHRLVINLPSVLPQPVMKQLSADCSVSRRMGATSSLRTIGSDGASRAMSFG